MNGILFVIDSYILSGQGRNVLCFRIPRDLLNAFASDFGWCCLYLGRRLTNWKSANARLTSARCPIWAKFGTISIKIIRKKESYLCRATKILKGFFSSSNYLKSIFTRTTTATTDLSADTVSLRIYLNVIPTGTTTKKDHVLKGAMCVHLHSLRLCPLQGARDDLLSKILHCWK